jgi:hypothetical protein
MTTINHVIIWSPRCKHKHHVCPFVCCHFIFFIPVIQRYYVDLFQFKHCWLCSQLFHFTSEATSLTLLTSQALPIMSQRILSRSFTKGVSLKSSDWSKPEETAKSGIHVPSTPSVLSIPKNWKVATTTLSSSSFNRQFDLQRHSSSSLASSMSLFQQQAFDLKRLSSSSLVSKLGSPNGLSSNGLSSTRTRLISAQRNTTWDEVSAPKQQPNGT